MRFWKPKEKRTQAVVVQRATGDDGKAGRIVQTGVVQILAGAQWVTGRDANHRDVFQIPASDVAVAFIEDVPNG